MKLDFSLDAWPAWGIAFCLALGIVLSLIKWVSKLNLRQRYQTWSKNADLAYERSRPLAVLVQIPFSDSNFEQLKALHRRAGNIFTVSDMQTEVARAVSERLGIDTANARVVGNPCWTGKKGSR